jgi:hypothetical protein
MRQSRRVNVRVPIMECIMRANSVWAITFGNHGNPHGMALAVPLKCSISTAGGSGAPLGKSLGAEGSFVLLAFKLGSVSQDQPIDTKVLIG